MSLDIVLDNAVRKAITNGSSIIALKGGLTIFIETEKVCILHLSLLRKDKLPSITEWETVLKFWPWPVSEKPTATGYILSATMDIHSKFL